ncbi:MAG: hypothetical protein KDB03_23960 [Planctomycetales bacterium]|nr:hypothetical protein [Planctomycetales bacterium]
MPKFLAIDITLNRSYRLHRRRDGAYDLYVDGNSTPIATGQRTNPQYYYPVLALNLCVPGTYPANNEQISDHPAAIISSFRVFE